MKKIYEHISHQNSNISLFSKIQVLPKYKRNLPFYPQSSIFHSCYFLISPKCFWNNGRQTCCMNALRSLKICVNKLSRWFLWCIILRKLKYRFCSNPLTNIVPYRSLLTKSAGRFSNFILVWSIAFRPSSHLLSLDFWQCHLMSSNAFGHKLLKSLLFIFLCRTPNIFS